MYGHYTSGVNGAVTIVDLRAEAERLARPLPPGIRSRSLSLDTIEEGQHGLSPGSGTYLVVCQQGSRAALAARYLRADGLNAEAWRGPPEELAELAENDGHTP